MLKIKQKLTLDYIEELLGKIYSDYSEELIIPNKINYKGFGVFPALIQYYNTWLRTNAEKIIIDIQKGNEEGLKDFAFSYHGYYLLLMAWKKVSIHNSNSENIKYDFRPFTSKMFNLIDFLHPDLPKEDILLTCFDHFPVDKGLVNWLYSSDGEFPIDEENLSSNFYRALQHSIRNYKTVVGSKVSLIFDDLTGIIWELMKNTHEWAKKDHLNKEVLFPNGRGVFIKFHRSNLENLNIYAENHKGLLEYYSRKEELAKAKKYFLEVSIYDSGPGLVKRFLGSKWNENLDIQEQVNIVKRCLTVHSTSAKGMNKIHKGAGLDRTLSILNEMEGFLRIRSGNVALYRDLVAKPYIKGANPEQIELNDWSSHSVTKFTKMPHAEGTLITLAFPLN